MKVPGASPPVQRWGLIGVASLAVACGGSPAPEEAEDGTCEKVDILFVIDDSGSMSDNQDNLARNFPKFADSIKTSLGANIDYHVGVVTSDEYEANRPGCTQLGALVTQTGGEASSNRVCGPFKSQASYLDSSDALAESFDCLARVGASGSGLEDVIGASTAALAEPINRPGSCNAGFLRPDSLLVLVLVTDEDTVTLTEGLTQAAKAVGAAIGVAEGPDDLPAVWQRKIAEASGHAPDATVVVSLLKGVPGHQCAPDEAGEDGKTLMDFTQRYKYSFLGDICAPDYGDVLVRALEPVSHACQNLPEVLGSAAVGGDGEDGTDDEESVCRTEGPGVKDWLLSTLAVLGGSAALSFAGFQTLARSLAGSGYRQSAANGAAIGFGMLLGGPLGAVVTVLRDCGLGSAPGWLGLGVSGVGLAVLLLNLVSGKK